MHERYQAPLIATDIIIEYKNGAQSGIVLIKRKNPPLGYALPGGMAEYGLSLEMNAMKEAKEETGLDIIIEEWEKPFCVHSDPGRDPRCHVVSVTYIAAGAGRLCAGDDAACAKVYTRREIRELIDCNLLAFDHASILMKYLKTKGEAG